MPNVGQIIRELKDAIVDLSRRVEELEQQKNWDNFGSSGGTEANFWLCKIVDEDGDQVLKEVNPEDATLTAFHKGMVDVWDAQIGDNLSEHVERYPDDTYVIVFRDANDVYWIHPYAVFLEYTE